MSHQNSILLTHGKPYVPCCHYSIKHLLRCWMPVFVLRLLPIGALRSCHLCSPLPERHALFGSHSWQQNPLTISGYSDSNYVDCVDTSRSVGGSYFTLGSGMIFWSSKKQTTVANSSCYVEYCHDSMILFSLFMPTFFFLVYFTLSHVTLLSHGSHVQSHDGSPDLSHDKGT